MPPQQLSIDTLSGFGAFTRVITRGKRYEKEPIKAFIYSTSSIKTKVHIGYAITKQIRKATQRNRLKRFMREAFRIHKQSFIRRLNPGMLIEIVFMYNGDSKTAPCMVRFESINQAFSALCSTIEIIRAK